MTSGRFPGTSGYYGEKYLLDLTGYCVPRDTGIFPIVITSIHHMEVNHWDIMPSGSITHIIHGTGIFTYMKTIKINHSCI